MVYQPWQTKDPYQKYILRISNQNLNSYIF